MSRARDGRVVPATSPPDRWALALGAVTSFRHVRLVREGAFGRWPGWVPRPPAACASGAVPVSRP
ncbi:hypothetical protein [Saccharothrix longispora]|uniref:hypothetical protein n=1 Tax=Saccharothrix longispora TaxID=33920 RepID=UPI0028FD513A|nr:hypothetical protein [Saccharothrix longispora]MDU0290910.1 hypothetical protein [Saccharothrix longispora]